MKTRISEILPKNTLFLLPLGLFLLLTGCTDTDLNPISIQGTVYDKNGATAKDISVVVESCNGGSGDSQCVCSAHKFTIGSGLTDANGHYIIKGHESRSNYYWISANKWGSSAYGVSLNNLPTVLYTP
jgi:hypothetical protein